MTDVEVTAKDIGGFRILRRLASGATSDVLLARAEGPHGFRRIVALKILLARRQGTPELEQEFAAQASAYARLTSPSVVKLYDFFSADGQVVMVLEFVDGLPLHKLRAMLAITGQRIDDKAALYLGWRVFGALAAAHAARDPTTGQTAPVVHFDVNPSNILVPWDGQVKVGDFGIAHAAGLEADARAGFIKGTYGYSAPEQVAGNGGSERSDVYSAGLILWELLARRKAVQKGSLNDAQVLKAMAHPEFPALELLRPDLAAPVRTAVRRALEPDPEKRTLGAAEMVTILREAFDVDEGPLGVGLGVDEGTFDGSVGPARGDGTALGAGGERHPGARDGRGVDRRGHEDRPGADRAVRGDDRRWRARQDRVSGASEPACRIGPAREDRTDDSAGRAHADSARVSRAVGWPVYRAPRPPDRRFVWAACATRRVVPARSVRPVGRAPRATVRPGVRADDARAFCRTYPCQRARPRDPAAEPAADADGVPLATRDPPAREELTFAPVLRPCARSSSRRTRRGFVRSGASLGSRSGSGGHYRAASGAGSRDSRGPFAPHGAVASRARDPTHTPDAAHARNVAFTRASARGRRRGGLRWQRDHRPAR